VTIVEKTEAGIIIGTKLRFNRAKAGMLFMKSKRDLIYESLIV